MTESKKKTSSRQTKKTKATTKKASSKPAKEAASKTTRAKPATPAAPSELGRSAATARKSEPAARTASPAGKASGTIQVKLVRSLIGRTEHQRAVVAGLGLRRLNQTVQRKDTKEIRGMVAKVPHLVTILG